MRAKLSFDVRNLSDEQLRSKLNCYKAEAATFSSYAAQVSKEIRRRKKLADRNTTTSNSKPNSSNNLGATKS